MSHIVSMNILVLP